MSESLSVAEIDSDVRPPQISDETMKEMAAFFMKTSIPRIIAAEKEKVKEAIKNESLNTSARSY